MSGPMTTILRPLECFSGIGRSVCVWLNGSPLSERTCWRWLWNGAELRACTDGAANMIRERVSYGALHRPCIITGDFDSISAESKEFFARSHCDILHTPDQDKTDLTKCLEIIEARIDKLPARPSRVVILGGLSGRFDHTLATINSLLNASHSSTPVFVIDGDNLTFVLGQGDHVLSLKQRDSVLTGVCGVVPFCQTETRVTTTGLRWNLDDTPMRFGGIISTSNQLEADELTIKTTAPVIVSFELRTTVAESERPPIIN